MLGWKIIMDPWWAGIKIQVLLVQQFLDICFYCGSFYCTFGASDQQMLQY